MTPKPSVMARKKGYVVVQKLNDFNLTAANPDWKPVAGFPEYEVNRLRQVRRLTTGAYSQPYKYMLRPDEGEFVDFWISGQRHVISLDSIMSAAFPKED